MTTNKDTANSSYQMEKSFKDTFKRIVLTERVYFLMLSVNNGMESGPIMCWSKDSDNIILHKSNLLPIVKLNLSVNYINDSEEALLSSRFG